VFTPQRLSMTSMGKPMRISLVEFEREIKEEREALPSYSDMTKCCEVQQEQNPHHDKEDEVLENSFCDLQKQMENFQKMEDSSFQDKDQIAKSNSFHHVSQGTIFEEFETLNAHYCKVFIIAWK
jgi:hypothetical protein